MKTTYNYDFYEKFFSKYFTDFGTCTVLGRKIMVIHNLKAESYDEAYRQARKSFVAVLTAATDIALYNDTLVNGVDTYKLLGAWIRRMRHENFLGV